MANASTTQASSACETTGAAIPLCYGYVWATGKRHAYYQLQNTGDDKLDFTRIGIWLLGHGEWDGCQELWLNDDIVWRSEWDDQTQFHFHRGTDAIIGSGLYPCSSGPDQGVDSFYSSFPSAIQPLAFNRIAYYAIKRKQPIQNQANDHQNDPAQWGDINPVGLWRALRCRLFDASGNSSGYAFTTNPAWHFVDVILRRKLMPEYNLSLAQGPDPLTPAVAARFNWESIYESARYYDEILANGRRRFIGNYSFTQSTSLQAVLSQMLICCRSFMQESNGQIYLICDKPRPSVFIFSRKNVLPGSFEANDQSLHTAPNRHIAKFRDLLVPAASEIESISCSDHSNPQVTTKEPHPFNAKDRIAIGGSDSIYDGQWTVFSVPKVSSPTTLTLVSKGSNYPSSTGEGGYIGLLYSRFKERAPEFWHKANMLARGAVGLNIPRQRNKVKIEHDFATCTYDQASRLARYERDRTLGADIIPYVTPPFIKLRTSLFSNDINGELAAGIQPGDHVTVDDTLSVPYAGEYEVLDPLTIYPPTSDAVSSGSSIVRSPSSGSGEIEFTLGPYNEGIMYEDSDALQAGWPSVPDSDPGNDGQYTAVDLEGDGKLAIISGAEPSGSTFDLPSSGFNPSQMLAWSSPQGYIEKNHVMHVIALCEIDSNRMLTLNYEDGDGNIWNGDVNFFAATWMGDSTSASTSDVGGIHFLVATLAGGETICFGKGILSDGDTIQLPTGFSMDKVLAIASPHDGNPWDSAANGHQAHGVGTYVDSGGVVHLNYQDGEGHVWHGNATVLLFAWKNNSGSVSVENVGSGKWMTYQTSTGYTLGVGMATQADSSSFELPSVAGNATSLQLLSTPRDFQIVNHPAHGVGACYVDANLKVHMLFEDGEGHVWTGNADVFALFYEPNGAVAVSKDGISIAISPLGVNVPLGGTQQFTAYVYGSSNTAVTWSVDGILGGNATVGIITSDGLYTAPSTSGTHVINAASQANSAAYGGEIITVGTGSATGGSSVGVVITPLSAALSPDDLMQFSAVVSGSTNTSVTWSVDGVPGGNEVVGTVDESGLYSAPPTTGYHRVTATSVSSTSSAGSATVVIGTGGTGSTGGVGGQTRTSKPLGYSPL